MLIREWEQVLPIETRRPLGETRIKPVKEVGGTNYEQAVIVLQSIHLVEEVASSLRRDNGFDVF